MSKWIPLFVLFLLASICTGDPLFTKLLYQSVPHRFCSRYYHRHGGIGCHTSTDGSSGNLVLYSVNHMINPFLFIEFNNW